MKTSGTRCFWVAAIAALISSAVFSQRSVTPTRVLLHEQELLLRKNEQLSTEVYRLRSELAGVQGEARAYKKLYAQVNSER